MPQRFQIGQQVILARPDNLTGMGNFSISLRVFGHRFEIVKVDSYSWKGPNGGCDALYQGQLLRSRETWSFLDNMLDGIATRTSGTKYRLITKGWAQEVFAISTLTDPGTILHDLVQQVGEARVLTARGGSTVDRIEDAGGQYTALRL